MPDPRFAWLLSGSEQIEVGNVGGKAVGLAELLRLGAEIPATVVVTAEAMAATARGTEIAGARDCLRTAPLPDRFARELWEAWEALRAVADTAGGVIIRSSSTIEDVVGSIAPGVFNSVRAAATFDDIIGGVRAVWDSAYTADAVAYAARHASASVRWMGVVIQPVVHGEYGGAVRTVDPSTEDASVVVVSWSERGAAAILQGQDAGYTVVLAKQADPDTWDVPAAVAAAAAAAVRFELCSTGPLDLEFVAQEDTVCFLQLRPAPYRPRWLADARLVCEVGDERTLRSGKVVALRRSAEVLPSDAELYVVRPPAYARYVAAGCRIDDELRSELAPLFERLVPNGPVSVRPAYWSARSSPDSLPQSGRLTTTRACLDHLAQLWEHIRTHGLDDYSAEVAAICGNWLPVDATAVVAADPRSAWVRVDAVLGYPEGLESLPHDTLIIDGRAGEIIERRVAHKALAVLEPRCPPVAVPVERRDEVAVDDPMAFALVHAAAQLAKRSNATIRAEYLLVQAGRGTTPLLWQLEEIHHDLPTTRVRVRALADPGEASPAALAAGRALRICRFGDLNLGYADAAGRIALIDLSAVDPRARHETVVLVEHLQALELPVVIQASPLSHIAALLRDYGVRFWAVPSIGAELASDDPVEVIADT